MPYPHRFRATVIGGLVVTSAAALSAQGVQSSAAIGTSTEALTLRQARERALRYGPELVAAREGVAAAAARARQAGAFPNPTFAYAREHTSRDSETNAQDVATLEQALELGGQRDARRDAARLRHEAAEARLRALEAQIVFDVTRAYALAVAADRRAALAEQAASAFSMARTVSERRLAAGDVSGYANRRVRLESARYATLRAEALLARRAARLNLSAFVSASADSVRATDFVLADSLVPVGLEHGARSLAVDSLLGLALRNRAELRATELEAQATAAEARLTRRERIPVPVVSGGIKREQVAGASADFRGFVVGISLPLPLWDRRGGAVAAAEAEARRRIAETDVVRRRAVREVEEAHDALRAAVEQVALLESQLGSEARAALHAAQVAYAEGEISVVEWLDAVRAYQEAEASYASLRAEALIRRAALERAVGTSLFDRADGASSTKE